MDIEAEKLDLIRWLEDIDEPSVLKPFIALKKRQQADWWDQIGLQEMAEIEEGLLQADNGALENHEDVMAKYQKWRSK